MIEIVSSNAYLASISDENSQVSGIWSFIESMDSYVEKGTKRKKIIKKLTPKHRQVHLVSRQRDVLYPLFQQEKPWRKWMQNVIKKQSVLSWTILWSNSIPSNGAEYEDVEGKHKMMMKQKKGEFWVIWWSWLILANDPLKLLIWKL